MRGDQRQEFVGADRLACNGAGRTALHIRQEQFDIPRHQDGPEAGTLNRAQLEAVASTPSSAEPK
jgi:hypothetical protein